ncbi:helix-turn-helix transcriptional regulator [Dolosigranulum savutiense]|uniref:Helix-turn-helix transcriptional regulator n=1 Tax=Dolosigranulum savutiense TaxID=3110288 RepID=A0AB74TWQ8_9LACT
MDEQYSLKQWRNLRGYSQEELAREVGVSTRTISNYENDVENLGNASYRRVQKIVNVLNIKLDQIFLGDTSEKQK